MTIILLFFSSFILVFSLGLQSQLTNNEHYAGAFVNSFAISIAQIGSLQVIHASTAAEYAAFIAGGPLAIVCSMLFFKKYIKRKKL